MDMCRLYVPTCKLQVHVNLCSSQYACFCHTFSTIFRTIMNSKDRESSSFISRGPQAPIMFFNQQQLPFMCTPLCEFTLCRNIPSKYYQPILQVFFFFFFFFFQKQKKNFFKKMRRKRILN